MLILKMSTTDWIQFWLAIGTGLLAVISVVAMWITISQNAKINYENSRAKLLFYVDYIRANDRFFLTIKNFGNSMGKLNYIKITPNLDYQKIEGYIGKHTLLTDSKDIVLAPNQKISSWFSFRYYPDKIFDIEISFTSLNGKKYKTFIEKYKIDLSFISDVENLSHWAIDCPDDKHALILIENQLAEISERIK